MAKRTPAVPELGEYEGRDVLRSEIVIKNAGDGLSDPLGLDPIALHHDDIVYVVLKCEVTDVSHPRIKDTGCLRRKHTLVTQEALIIDGQLVAGLLDQQRQRIRLAKGQPTLEDAANGDA